MDIEVDRDELRRTRVVSGEPLPEEPGPGAVLCRIDSFALTTNNVTYAVLGDTLGYWRRFPAPDTGWGRVPVWGHAEVVATACPAVSTGERFFGFWPMSSHVLLEPVDTAAHGFTDGAAREAGLAAVYSRYQRTPADGGSAAEARTALLRPLFATSFLIDDWLRANAVFGADTVVISSASSKTSLGLAHLLAASGGPRVIGLTSARHAGFTAATGAYDEVLTYDEVPATLGDGPAVYVDLAGDPGVLAAVHEHFGDRLARSVRVGFTHREAPSRAAPDLPGATPELFFAPDHVERRSADWGARGFAERLGTAEASFADGPGAALTIDHRRGAEAICAAWEAAVDGTADPSVGVICSW